MYDLRSVGDDRFSALGALPAASGRAPVGAGGGGGEYGRKFLARS